MTRPRNRRPPGGAPNDHDIRNVPLPSDAELIPHLQRMLENGLRRQVWVMLLDHELRPLPILVPTDVPPEPDPEDVLGVSDFLRCLALDFEGSTLVLTFERPGPDEVTSRDRRWLRLLHEAAIASEFPFRGPYLLLGSRVRAVPPDDYLAAEWLELDPL
ncbi:hypothetical protein ACFPJ4_03220 [Lysinimonas soli]|uniref:Uncharacterized protein n=1 Tax=Lysinimonas soli TaxID=1074233 RepID=A0ABW0NPW1_9MICO